MRPLTSVRAPMLKFDSLGLRPLFNYLYNVYYQFLHSLL